jgi:hypothetical protein
MLAHAGAAHAMMALRRSALRERVDQGALAIERRHGGRIDVVLRLRVTEDFGFGRWLDSVGGIDVASARSMQR